MSDDLSLERALIEELIGPISIVDHRSWGGITVIYRFGFEGRHVTFGPVGKRYDDSQLLAPDDTHCYNGWCLIPGYRHPILWPPCSFAEFIEKLRDPKIREACGLKPMEEM